MPQLSPGGLESKARTPARKSRSVPSLPAGGHRVAGGGPLGGQNGMLQLPRIDPFSVAQPLFTTDICSRKVVKHAISAGKRKEAMRQMSEGRLSFFAFERGLEWERPQAKAQTAPEALPKVRDILKMAAKEMDLSYPLPKGGYMKSGEVETPKPKIRIWSGPKSQCKNGPALPVRKQLPTFREVQAAQMQRLPAAEQLELVDTAGKLTAAQPHLVAAAAASPNAGKRQRKAARIQEDGCDEDAPKQGHADRSDDGPRSSLARSMSMLMPAEEPIEEPIEWLESTVPWDEELLQKVFTKFDTDKDLEVHTDDLTAVLRYLGARPAHADVVSLAREQTQYATLSFLEFQEFINRFRRFDVEQLREQFSEADTDKGGTLCANEIHRLLQKLGWTPTMQTTLEAVEAIDEDGSGDISFKEFEQLREYLQNTGGFAKADVAELRDLYKRAAGGENRELETDQIYRIIAYRGYAASKKLVESVSAGIDADGSGLVSFDELLKIVRRVRDLEREKILSIIEDEGTGDGVLRLEDLGIALIDLGYTVGEEAVWEILDALGECEDEKFLTVEELAAFLRGYRRVEGFTEEEMTELNEEFNKEDEDNSESLSALELGHVLRWFGFTRSLQQVQRLVEEVDFDGSGSVEFSEFVKLMRQLHHEEGQQRRAVFARIDKKGTGAVDVEALNGAIEVLDGVPPDEDMVTTAIKMAAPTEQRVSIQGFESFFYHYRKLSVARMRDNQCYSAAEVAKLHGVFASYDADNSGTVELAELRSFISDYFPDATKSRAQSLEMQKIVDRISGGVQELDFKMFLALMRKCDDMRDATDIRLESEVVKECGFTTEEVEGFRQIFSATANWAGELNLEAIGDLLKRVMEFGDNDMVNLQRLVCEVHPEGREAARFPTFLKLVKCLTDNNALGLNDAANRINKLHARRHHVTS